MLPTLRVRSFVALFVVASLIAPTVSAAPTEVDRKALADFEAGFNAGQQKADAGQYVDAARTWVEAASHLKETAANRDNRQAVFEYVADAWTRGLEAGEDVALLREAVAALDGYCDAFTVAYGTETPILAKIVTTRDSLRERLKQAETSAPAAAEGPADLPPKGDADPPGAASGPKWRGLAIGGGVALGVGVGFLVMAAVGGARGASIEGDFNDQKCDVNNLMGACTDLSKSGKTMNALAITGGVVGGVLLVTGAALLGIGLKRRAAARNQAFAPAFAPNFVGLTLRGSF